MRTRLSGKEELIIFPVTEKFKTTEFDEKTQDSIKQRKYTGKAGKTLLVHNGPDKLLIGMKRHDEDSYRKMAGAAVKYARENSYEHIAFQIEDLYAQAVTEGSILGAYEYTEFKKLEEKNPEVTIITADAKAVKKGEIIAEGVLLVRDLVNRPASDKVPKNIVAEAKKLAKKYGFSVKVLGGKELARLGMNSMLGVNKGSVNDAQLCILELNSKLTEKPVALVGKGVTFDSGGLQIKPGDAMLDMKMDMAGAATVLGTLVTLARLGHKGRVVGALGLVENLVGPQSYKPKDILKSYTGKTIEVLHTDAEGRLVLADVLAYIEKQYMPSKTIDLATLTGAAVIALGYRVAAVIGNDRKVIEEIKKASEETDELVWELPLLNHYKDMMKGNISDLRNIAKNPEKYGPGTITAAAFLSEFVKGPWAHLDIAGTAFSYEQTDYNTLGGTGWGVRLLTHMINR